MRMLDQILNIVLTLEGGILLAFFFAAFLTSLLERELRAVLLFLMSGILSSMPFLLPIFPGFEYPLLISIALSALFLLPLLVLFIPFRGRMEYKMQIPSERFDERDTMFSRRSLVPGTEQFDEYYDRHPGNKPLDEQFRKKPGLLKAGTSYYDPILFAATNSIFEKVNELHPRVEGEPAEVQPGLEVPPGSNIQPGSKIRTGEENSRMLLGMAVDWGAWSAGITELRDYHVYSHGGRGGCYGDEFEVEHKYALALTVEMDYDMMRTAPDAPTVLESAKQYLQSGMIAVQLAEYIRALGYPARAHIDGNYKVICPLVARDAGLGEIGRMGLLMTPGLGPRCRIAVLTTDLPLIPMTSYGRSAKQIPERSNATVIDFCRRCEKCALNCPEQDNIGLSRWKIDDASCFTYWCQAGTDCGRCMIVCPYSHPDNWFHRFIRFGIRNNSIFRRLAVPMDDIFYGKRPPSRKVG